MTIVNVDEVGNFEAALRRFLKKTMPILSELKTKQVFESKIERRRRKGRVALRRLQRRLKREKEREKNLRSS